MALNFQIPKQKKNQDLKTLQEGFGIPLAASLRPSLPNVPLGDLPEGITKFGTYYYGSLFIEQPFYGVPEYDEETKTYSNAFVSLASNRVIGGVSGCFIESCIIDCNEVNNVVKTTISGQDGSVKEYINKGDSAISIRGFFSTGLPDLYPEINVRMLKSYLTSPVSLSITNSFLNDIFGITKIVVESFNFFQQEGLRNVQYFQINAISDNDYTIKELSK